MIALLPRNSNLTHLELDDAQLQQNGSQNVSPLDSINGTGAAEYLESYSSRQGLQDRDAQ